MSAKINYENIDVDGNILPPIPLREPPHDGRNCPLGLDYAVKSLEAELVEFNERQREGFGQVLTKVKDLSDRVLDPENGLHSRIKGLEGHSAAITKWAWIALTAFTGAALATISRLFI